MKKSLLPFLFFGLLTLAFLFSCKTEKAPFQEKKIPNDSTSLRLALVQNSDCFPLYYAVETGICAKLDLSLYIHSCESQFDADTTLRGKTVDGGFVDAFRAKEGYYGRVGTQLKPLFTTRGKWKLLSNSRMRIREVKQLKGRTVAMARFAVSDYFLQHLKDSARIKAEETYPAQINNYRLRWQMLDNNQVDAAVLPEPYASWAEQKGHRVLAVADAQRFGGSIAMKASAMAHPRKAKQIEKLKEVYAQAVKEINANPHRADSVWTISYGVPAEAAKQLRLSRW